MGTIYSRNHYNEHRLERDTAYNKQNVRSRHERIWLYVKIYVYNEYGYYELSAITSKIKLTWLTTFRLLRTSTCKIRTIFVFRSINHWHIIFSCVDMDYLLIINIILTNSGVLKLIKLQIASVLCSVPPCRVVSLRWTKKSV